MATIHERIAMRIKQQRERRGLTQKQLAEKAGLSHGYLARLEIGMHDPPLSTVAKLARALQCKIADLV